jgi:uncharacterized protein DUF4386
MASSYPVRLGAIAGWTGFVGIVAGFIVVPTLLAGTPPTVNTDLAAVAAYFRHPEFAVINGFLGVFVGAIAIVVFAYGLRTALRQTGDSRTRTFADLGLAILMVSVPVYIVSATIGATLVQAADGDAGTFATLFRLYEITYDGAADVLEGTWILSFSIATLGSPFPRWLGWLGITVGISRWIKATIPFGAPLEAIIPLSGILFVVWFLGMVVALTNAARRPALSTTAEPMAA